VAPRGKLVHHTSKVSLYAIPDPHADDGVYVFSHETRCQGRIMAILPWQDTKGGRRYLLKTEVTPAWGPGPTIGAITGGWEGASIADDAVRELREETGYEADRAELVSLGECYASKSADTVYGLFAVDLTGRRPGPLTGDGTRDEAASPPVWLTAAELINVKDAQVAVMYLRLEAALQISAETMFWH
jgi:8-oxo-dGTP pyrophosphatase MutT (NUDIX family)